MAYIIYDTMSLTTDPYTTINNYKEVFCKQRKYVESELLNSRL